MNTKTLAGNRKMLAMILSVAVIATIGGSLAFAQTAGSTSGQSSTGTVPPKIQGSVNLQQLLLSNVQTKFTDAANTAAGAVTNGQVISGSLSVIQGSVVYNFKVIDGTNMYSVIVDAGTGKVLNTSTGHPIQLGGLLGAGHGGLSHYGMAGKHHMGMGGSAWKSQQPSSTPTSPPATGTQ
jgi:Peptidase propeptide and YPEB domain